jgi:hypothetical protein
MALKVEIKNNKGAAIASTGNMHFMTYFTKKLKGRERGAPLLH